MAVPYFGGFSPPKNGSSSPQSFLCNSKIQKSLKTEKWFLVGFLFEAHFEVNSNVNSVYLGSSVISLNGDIHILWLRM